MELRSTTPDSESNSNHAVFKRQCCCIACCLKCVRVLRSSRFSFCSGCLPGQNDISLDDYALDDCKRACIDRPSCASIDWYPGRSGHTCSLSASTFADVGQTSPTQDCRFYELDRSQLSHVGSGHRRLENDHPDNQTLAVTPHQLHRPKNGSGAVPVTPGKTTNTTASLPLKSDDAAPPALGRVIMLTLATMLQVTSG